MFPGNGNGCPWPVEAATATRGRLRSGSPAGPDGDDRAESKLMERAPEIYNNLN